MQKIVIVSDLSIPQQHQPAIRGLARFVADYEPEKVILLGEIVRAPQDEPTSMRAHLDGLREIVAMVRYVHRGTVGIHPGRTLVTWLRKDAAQWVHTLQVTVLPGFYPILPGWLSTHGEDGPRSAYPGGKAISLARKTGRSIVCGTGGHGPTARIQIDLDVVVLAAQDPNSPRRILSLGEATWGEVMSHHHLDRLTRARELLRRKGYNTDDTILACYGAAGFTAELTTAAATDEKILLVGLDHLYEQPLP